MTEGTEDQKTLAVLSLMWMVERRKEEQREEQRDKEREEAEQREVQRKKEMEEGEHTHGDWEKMNPQERRGKKGSVGGIDGSTFAESGGQGRGKT